MNVKKFLLTIDFEYFLSLPTGAGCGILESSIQQPSITRRIGGCIDGITR
jgi:hypothetical protein